MRKCFPILTLALVAGSLAFGQKFEVASIRPAETPTAASIQGGKTIGGPKVDGLRVSFGFVSLRDLIPIAYELKPYQVVGPDWMATARFDISAVMPEGGTKEQVPAMLRDLLAVRFNLKVHRETKEQNVYWLVEGKGGHKMKPAPELAPPSASAEPAPAAKGERVLGIGDQQIRITENRGAAAGGGTLATINSSTTGNTKISMVGGTGLDAQIRLEMERVTMPALIQQLTPMVDLPIMDHTGLTGAYQVALQLSMMDMLQTAKAVTASAGLPMQLPNLPGGAAAGTASDPSGASIFASIQQLGLRLDKQKADIDRVVVDSADKAPSEN